jgi:hypothetical protein
VADHVSFPQTGAFARANPGSHPATNHPSLPLTRRGRQGDSGAMT